ncbi:hypothetical protein niasHT_013267 [Heterodera trifolii]|uniref:Uncharacterized protein n=1 Tax=Heterodera trifolii TaxID=157864 RepID=A0ABD2LAR3_9BILA
MYFGFICAILAFSLYVGEGMPINPPSDKNDCDFITDLEVLAACKEKYMNRRMGLNPDQNEARIGSKLDKYKEQYVKTKDPKRKRKIIDDHQKRIETYKTSKQEGRRMSKWDNHLAKLLGVEPSKKKLISHMRMNRLVNHHRNRRRPIPIDWFRLSNDCLTMIN